MAAKVLGTVFFLAAWGLGASFFFHRARGKVRVARISIAGLGAVLLLAVLVFASDLAMQKVAGKLVMPVGLAWVALGALAADLAGRGLRGPFFAALGLFVAHTVLGNPIFSAYVVRALEAGVPEYALAGGPQFDAVLVHGGGVGYRAGGDVQLSDQGDRVILGARLWYAKKTPILVASGSTIEGFHEVEDLAAAARRLWVELGIPPEVIVEVPEPKNTSQELAAFKALAAERGWSRLGVISSRWHLPRILAKARALGLEVTPIPADHRGSRPEYHPALLVPQAGPWKAVQMAAWEWLGAAVGR